MGKKLLWLESLEIWRKRLGDIEVLVWRWWRCLRYRLGCWLQGQERIFGRIEYDVPGIATSLKKRKTLFERLKDFGIDVNRICSIKGNM